MNLNRLKILEINKLFILGKLTPYDYLKHCQKRYEKFKTLNFLLSSSFEKSLDFCQKYFEKKDTTLFKKSKLCGIPFFCKDNIAVKGEKLTGGSLFLEHFYAPFNAEVITRLFQQKALCVGKTNLDELGLGGTGLNQHFSDVLNPWNLELITGGSSSGSAVAVACRVVPFALGSDTGNSIRFPAAHCGIVGFKPTYGLISRWGLISFAPSLDTIGIMANYVDDIKIIFENVVGFDPKDQTTLIQKNFFLLSSHQENVEKLKVVVFKEWIENIPHVFKEVFLKLVEKISKQGVAVEYINFPKEIFHLLNTLYEVISYNEALSSQQNLQGITFGGSKKNQNFKSYEELVVKQRTKNLGWNVKRRYFWGKYVSEGDNYQNLLLKANKIRTVINNYFDEFFKKYDFFIHLTSCFPKKVNEMKKQVFDINSVDSPDSILLLANFAGLPSISIPAGWKDNFPYGFTINGERFFDKKLLFFSKFCEDLFLFTNPFFEKDN